MSILQLNTSLFGDAGQSSQLADEFVSRLQQRERSVKVTRRDLSEQPVGHLTSERFLAALTPATERTPEQQREAALADRLIAELQEADTVVIGLPMYNFSVPSTLKAWFDHVARAGTTFRYTANGPQGLLSGKKLYVIATRGGVYAGTGSDLLTPLVKQFFGLLGINNIEFIYAEGLAMGEESRDQAIADAEARVAALAA